MGTVTIPRLETPLHILLCVFTLMHAAVNAEVFGSNGSNATTIGQCIFYGGDRVECHGRLRCKPSDFQATSGRQQLPDLEHICPGVDEVATGNWSLIQGIVPADYASVPYPAEVVAKCYFRTNGSFFCVGGPTHADTFWEGVYSGSLNSAFELGLDKWYFRHLTTTPTTTTTTRRTVRWTRPTTRYTTRKVGYLPSRDVTPYVAGQVPVDKPDSTETIEQVERYDPRENNRRPQYNNDVDGEDGSERGSDDDRYPERTVQREEFDRETYGSGGAADNNENGDGYDASTPPPVTYDDIQRVSGTRDEINRYDAQRAAQLEDNDETSITFTVAPQRVYVCEYYNNGQVGCRNCTEKIMRVRLDTGETANRRDYNCSQPRTGPVMKRWNIDNGIIPMTPDPEAILRLVVATCIFEKSAQTYECHGESALCPDNVSNSHHTNKCLGGKRWSGDYTGDFGYLT